MPIDVDVVHQSIHTTKYSENVRALWLGLLAGPIFYALYFIAGYLLAEAVCRANILSGAIGGFSQLLIVMEGVTLLAIALTLMAALYCYRVWRRRAEMQESGGALPFMALGGLLLNSLFTLFMVVTGVSILFINVCRWI